MNKKSAVVSGMGLGLGMLTNADQVRKEMGITDEQFHVLATDEGREYWRRLFKTMQKESSSRYEICTVTIGGYKSLEDAIEAGKYDRCNPDITSEHFPLSGNGQKKDIEITLVHRDKSEQSQNLIDEMDEVGYRPATHEEFLALGAQHPELQRKFPIIALGADAQVDGHRSVLVLHDWDGERKLSLSWFGHDWPQRCRFAFVRKN